MSIEDRVPATVDYEGLRDAFASIGIWTEDLMRAVILPNRVELTYARTGHDGRKIRAGDEIATVTVTIGVRYSKTATEA